MQNWYARRTVRFVSSHRPESSRIAHELHDVVAHGLSAIAVQAEAAQAALRRDPSSVEQSLGAIRAAAHEALDDVRRLLAMSSDGDDLCDRMPQPGLAQVPHLVHRATAAGQPVTLVTEGTPRPVPASLELAAYRVLQEALGNACERAPGAATAVRVTWTDDALELEVSDTGGGLRRTAGMRERVRVHGGELHAGAGRRGRYRVSATFPV
jgi:signal transduction histidine kinase